MYIDFFAHTRARLTSSIVGQRDLRAYYPLQWRHNGYDDVSNHQPPGCLLNRLFRRGSKKTSKLRVTGLCAGIHQWPVNSPHKWPVTRKMFPFDDVIKRVWLFVYIHRCLQYPWKNFSCLSGALRYLQPTGPGYTNVYIQISQLNNG